MKFKEIYPINYDRIYYVKDETLQDFKLESLAEVEKGLLNPF